MTDKERTAVYITKKNKAWADENIRNLSAFVDTMIDSARRLREEHRHE